MLPVDEALARGRAFRLCLLLTLAVCPAAGAHADAWPARVSYVVDGDSLWVRPVDADGAATGPRARLRLVDIDAPEICQSGGLQARDALRALVQGRLVQVAVRARDRYGRALAVVTRADDQVDVAAELVRQGLAWSDDFGWRRSPYAALSDDARDGHRGLFADAVAQRPADFRRRHGPCPAPEAGRASHARKEPEFP